MTSHKSDSDDEDFDSWQGQLQGSRLLIVNRVNYEKIKAALLTVGVIDNDDNEEISNRFELSNAGMRLNRMVDILMRKGKDNYDKFMEVIGYYYADIYKQIKGCDPAPPKLPDLIRIDVDNHNNSSGDIVELLLEALDRMKQENFDTKQRLRRSNNVYDDISREAERLQKRVDELTQRVTRYENVDNEMDTLRKEVDRLKSENLSVCMRLIESNEESSKLRKINMSLENENDKTRADLQKMESCVKLERTQSVRLRRQLQTGPSDRDMIDMKREIDELRFKLTQANQQQASPTPIGVDFRIQILQRDKEEALEMYGETLHGLNKLREDCANAEKQRDEYLAEKEQLELECSMLRNDCNIYRNRRDSVWQQLQEVEKEREMIIKERNDAQLFARDCMQEKARYRAQIRELEEKYDKISRDLLDREKELAQHRAAMRSLPNLSDMTWKHPSGSSSNQTSIKSEYSDSTPECNAHEESKVCKGRYRLYNTKNYDKYASKSNTSLNMSIADCDGHKNVFPEIPLANDYGPQDSISITPWANGQRRTGIRIKHGKLKNSEDMSEVSAISTSNDDLTKTDKL
ncbi:caspase recruitment domain-containing protein 11-like isoform X1 [Clavelina lepadiformis]|uniref:caspase recruitment domain-containing protein 11-like isoform X1 n=1 Tax=Clavelina lepadiformis TaxID=159417 RepID=UPI0040421E82